MTDIPNFSLYLACLMFLHSCHKQMADSQPANAVEFEMVPQSPDDLYGYSNAGGILSCIPT